jgi:hypothetical protein
MTKDPGLDNVRPSVDQRMGGWHGVGYDDIEVGQTWPASAVTISSEMLVRYYRCIGRKDLPGSSTPLPAFILNELRVLKTHMKLPPGVLHAQESLQMSSPAYADEALAIKVTILDKYIKNGKRFVCVAQMVHRTLDGTLIMTLQHTLYWPC